MFWPRYAMRAGSCGSIWGNWKSVSSKRSVERWGGVNEITLEPDTEEMNALQGAGIISDNCVQWSDVAECDRERAYKWLTLRKGALL
jgi:hypothetical protein